MDLLAYIALVALTAAIPLGHIARPRRYPRVHATPKEGP